MRVGRGFLILGIVLVMVSYPLGWYATGGTGESLTLDDPRVKAALDALHEQSLHRRIATEGDVRNAWVSGHRLGYKVNLTIALGGNPWHAAVVFSGDDAALERSVSLSGGVLFPRYLRGLGVAIVAAWVLFSYLAPRLFGKKCPDCPGDFWHPALLDVQESTVYPGGWDDDGDLVAPVARRDFVCPRCGYRKVTYFVPGEFRPATVFRSPMSRSRVYMSVKFDEIAQEVLDKWFVENAERTRFHNQSEWLEFYNELKASEREERTVR